MGFVGNVCAFGGPLLGNPKIPGSIGKLIEQRNVLNRRYRIFDEPSRPKLHAPDPEGIRDAYTSEDAFVRELKQFILDNVEKVHLGPGEVARHFGLSRSQLYRKLKSALDKTLVDYLREIRCNLALKAMMETNASISCIAYDVGFSSLSYFSRSFKRHFGKSPTAMAALQVKG